MDASTAYLGMVVHSRRFLRSAGRLTVGNYMVHIENGHAIATFVTDQPDSVFPSVHNELEPRFLGA